jgi:predicted GNAT family N-acyltransferase
MGTLEIVLIDSPQKMALAHEIRRKVFIEEQHVPEEIELDEEDHHAVHALALLDGKAVGCGRFIAHDSDEVKIGRMAVYKELRGSGIGREILVFLMEEAKCQGFKHAILHAQLTAEGFYLKQGFKPIGEIFEEASIAHRAMQREL